MSCTKLQQWQLISYSSLSSLTHLSLISHTSLTHLLHISYSSLSHLSLISFTSLTHLSPISFTRLQPISLTSLTHLLPIERCEGDGWEMWRRDQGEMSGRLVMREMSERCVRDEWEMREIWVSIMNFVFPIYNYIEPRDIVIAWNACLRSSYGHYSS